MDEQTKQLILGWLQQVGAALKTAGEFVVEQTPLVIQEKILFARVEAAVYLLLGLTLLGLMVWVWRQVPRVRDDFLEVVISVGGLVSGIAGCILISEHLSPFLKVWFAPRVYILEWIVDGLR